MKQRRDSRLTTFLRACIHLLNGGTDGATFNKAVPAIVAGGAALSLLAFAGVTRVAADWTPPESSVTPPAVVILDAFAPSDVDGSYPNAPLVAGPDGALYGSTEDGGTNGGFGTLFRLEANGTFTKLHDFDGTDGFDPLVPMVVGPNGALYGSTAQGGTNDNNGTLFRLETNGTYAKLHDFNGADGANPSVALMAGPDGALYGSTSLGGTNDNNGTLFRLETNGIFTKLHDFNYDDGYYPFAALVAGSDGALYGSTQYGGSNGGFGTLFRLETNGTFTLLYEFNNSDGYYPSAAMVAGPDSALYGSTQYGGTNGGFGTLFKLETNGTFTLLHDFDGDDGAYPSAALVTGPDGALYGSASQGGTGDLGTLFRLETNGTFTLLHDFDDPDGAYLSAALAAGPDGVLYGLTTFGGTNGGYGTLFRLETDGTFTKLHDFNSSNGANPGVPLVAGSDGALYGSTPNGGPSERGILFKLVLNRAPVAQCHDVTVSAGANCAANASIDNGSSDLDDGDEITLSQDPPGPYVLGDTLVTLTVTDNHGASNSCSATVTVVDNTPPQIACPANIVIDATSPAGAVVSFTPTASDNCSLASVTSTPPSGSTFPIGTTTVTCRAIDGAGLTNSCTFTIRVNGVAAADSDGDGVPDTIDLCSATPSGAIVNATGCSIAQLVPCDGPRSGGTWKSHGQYVAAVVHVATDFLQAKLITRRQWVHIVTRAAHSKCGWNRRSDHNGDRDWHRKWDCDRDRDWDRGRDWGRD